MITELRAGMLLRHFKGTLYKVELLATFTEPLGSALGTALSQECVVYYEANEKDPELARRFAHRWVRPLSMFFDDIELPSGMKLKRFRVEGMGA